MEIIKLLNTILILLSLAGAVFITKGVLKLTERMIIDASSVFLEYNIFLIKNFLSQKTDQLTGFIVLGITLSLQLILTFINSTTTIEICFAVLIIVSTLTISLLILFQLNKNIYKRNAFKISKIINVNPEILW